MVTEKYNGLIGSGFFGFGSDFFGFGVRFSVFMPRPSLVAGDGDVVSLSLRKNLEIQFFFFIVVSKGISRI